MAAATEKSIDRYSRLHNLFPVSNRCSIGGHTSSVWEVKQDKEISIEKVTAYLKRVGAGSYDSLLDWVKKNTYKEDLEDRLKILEAVKPKSSDTLDGRVQSAAEKTL